MDLKQAEHLLQSSDKWRDQILINFNLAMRNKEVTIEFQNLIRYFTLDIFSTLDYCAFQILLKYCLKHIDPTKHNKAKRDVSFPTKFDSVEFHKHMEKVFPRLITEQNEIYVLLQTAQANWLKTLLKLNNHNKHRELIAQKEVTQIDTGLIVDGSNFIGFGENVNIRIENLTINGKRVPDYSANSNDVKPHPSFEIKKIITWTDILFKDLNVPLISTLDEIYAETENILIILKSCN